MSVGASGHRYMSNAEIAMWMSEQSGRLYDKMGKEMDEAETRQQISEELTSLKASLMDLKAMNESGEKCAKSAAAIREFLEAHQGTPGYEDICGKLELMADRLERFAQSPSTTFDWTDGARFGKPLEISVPEDPPSKDKIDSWTTDIQGAIEHLNKEDQMSMITIQDVNSRLAQTTQLASNLIATANQAASAVVNNIKG